MTAVRTPVLDKGKMEQYNKIYCQIRIILSRREEIRRIWQQEKLRR